MNSCVNYDYRRPNWGSNKNRLQGRGLMNTSAKMSLPVEASGLRGLALLRDPLLNKGTAFTAGERDALGLRGLLPAHQLSIKAQAERMLTNLRRLPNDLEKYV